MSEKIMQHHRLPPGAAGKQVNDDHGWYETTWGAIATLEYGKSLRGYETSAGPYKVYGTNGQIGWHSEPLCPHAGIIIGRKGAYRGVHYSPEPFCVIDTAFYLKPKTEIDARWAYYQLLTQDINSMDSGSAIPSTSRDDFYALPVTIPPLPEQRRIAHILGTLDDKIELNRRTNQTLEEIASAIYKDWFVDFGPVRAKMQGNEPYLPPDLWDLFPDDLVDSELGEIPEGWEVKALDDIADYRNGLALQKFRPEKTEERLPAVKIAQLRTGKANSGEWAKASITPECIIDDGDVIFSWSGSLMIKFWCGGRAALNQHLFKVTSKVYPKWFYLQQIESHLLDFQSIAADKTTTMGHIKREHLQIAKCVVSPQDLLDAADQVLGTLYSRQIATKLESNTLESQRDSLLPKFISGNIKPQ